MNVVILIWFLIRNSWPLKFNFNTNLLHRVIIPMFILHFKAILCFSLGQFAFFYQMIETNFYKFFCAVRRRSSFQRSMRIKFITYNKFFIAYFFPFGVIVPKLNLQRWMEKEKKKEKKEIIGKRWILFIRKIIREVNIVQSTEEEQPHNFHRRN